MPNAAHHPSLELCKRLTELGFPKTEKSWWRHCGNVIPMPKDIRRQIGAFEVCEVCPSVMEMLDVLPKKITDVDGETLRLCINLYDEGTCVLYQWFDEIVYSKYGPLPNALASMVIWLVENSCVTFPSHE